MGDAYKAIGCRCVRLASDGAHDAGVSMCRTSGLARANSMGEETVPYHTCGQKKNKRNGPGLGLRK